jgi:tRNA-specific 2-thiouridylase
VRVLAAMSGGVDSAVAAPARDAGHDVTGVHLALARTPATATGRARGLLHPGRRARRRPSRRRAGLPFYVWDLADRFAADVVDDFVAEYAAGRTPNPCLRCNERIKFAAVLDKALALGFDAVCTGHYAQVVDGPAGVSCTARSTPAKDQSYVLGVLDARQLAGAMFPLGASRKDDVRAEAGARGLAVADKPDSTDICFVADGDTSGFLARRLGSVPGEIVDSTGAVVGSHDGAYAFTVGQRRGLALSRPAADGRARYVLSVTPVSRTVTVGPAEDLDVDEVVGIRPRWTGRPPDGEVRALAQVRAHGEAVPACGAAYGDEVRVHLDRPLRAVAPGRPWCCTTARGCSAPPRSRRPAGGEHLPVRRRDGRRVPAGHRPARGDLPRARRAAAAAAPAGAARPRRRCRPQRPHGGDGCSD